MDEQKHPEKKEKKSAFSQFFKAPNKHVIVDKFTHVSVVQTSYVDHKQPLFLKEGVKLWWWEDCVVGGGRQTGNTTGRGGG